MYRLDSRKGFALSAPHSTVGIRRVVGLAVVLALGCGGGTDINPGAENHIRGLAVCYGQFQGQHKGKGPSSEQEFKQFISTKVSKEMLAAHRVTPDKIDPLFISPRDREPYQIRFKPSTKPTDMVIWEKTGVEGKRLVVLSTTQTELVDEAKFNELLGAQ